MQQLAHELTLSTCMTRMEEWEEVVIFGSEPPPGAPSDVHETLQSTVALTGNAPWSGSPSTEGSPADDSV